MNGLTLLVISVIVLALAYILYGRYLARKWRVEPARRTAAVSCTAKYLEQNKMPGADGSVW